MRLLLDTAVLILALESPEQLSRRAAAYLHAPDNILELSALSLSEMAIKAARGKLRFSIGSVRQAIEDLDIRVLPFTAEHAYRLFDLPVHHKDPFDRQIIAQALCEGILVVTCDEIFRMYEGLKIVW